LIAPVSTSLAGYRSAFDIVSKAMLKSDDLFYKQLQPGTVALIGAAGTAADSLTHDFDATRDATGNQILGTIAQQKWIAGAALVLGALIAWLVGRGIVRPISGMTSAMAKLAAGETEVAVPSREARDEMGAMAKAVEVFKQNAVERARLEVEQKVQVEKASCEKNAALVGMAEKIELESGAAMDAVGKRTAAIAVNAEEMSASATRTGESAQGAASAASQAMANVQTVASAAEQLAASIREIGGQVNQSTVVVGRAVTAGTEARSTMEALNEQVGRIGAVADMISEIAGKTNLLALNATIEAARAGDAGKGFAVVASEVKQLATQTARSTQEITRHIGEVRNATNASVEAVGRIEQTIGEINAIAGSIAAAVEQQGAATAEIARNVNETAAAANQMTLRINEVSAEAERTGQRSSQVREDTASLNTMVSELKLSLVRVVRTSTAEVNRREYTRYAVDLGCRLSAAGLGTRDARVQDISEHGAAVIGARELSISARGSLEVDRIGMQLPFVVRAMQGDMAHLIFELNPADSARLAQILGQMGLRQAA
jgi:methyl-accepting chemotaxis protein